MWGILTYLDHSLNTYELVKVITDENTHRLIIVLSKFKNKKDGSYAYN